MRARALRSPSVPAWRPKASTSNACHDRRAARRTSALIVGGGPAGSAAAIALARGGAMPVVVERSPGGRDIVCGGFLGWDAIAALARLGLEPGAPRAAPLGGAWAPLRRRAP